MRDSRLVVPVAFQRQAYPEEQGRAIGRQLRRRLHLLNATATVHGRGLVQREGEEGWGASGGPSERLSGDLLHLGYYSAELSVGTPLQTFSVIVDTGSSVTAIPCAGCTHCGRRRRFEPSLSATFKRPHCGDTGCERCRRDCESCPRHQCDFYIAYHEGSSYSGFVATDVLHLGGDLGGSRLPSASLSRSASVAPTLGASCVSLPFTFGCTTEESGLFRSQWADGILGLAQRVPRAHRAERETDRESDRESERETDRETASETDREEGGSNHEGREEGGSSHEGEGANEGEGPPPDQSKRNQRVGKGSAEGGGDPTQIPTVLEELVRSGHVTDDAFSLCIGPTRGRLSFGLPPPSADRFWTRATDRASLAVTVSAVRLGKQKLGRAPGKTIIGSIYPPPPSPYVLYP